MSDNKNAVKSDTLNYTFTEFDEKSKTNNSLILNTNLTLSLVYDSRTHILMKIVLTSSRSFCAEMTFYYKTKRGSHFKEISPQFHKYLTANETTNLEPIPEIIFGNDTYVTLIRVTVNDATTQVLNYLNKLKLTDTSEQFVGGKIHLKNMNELLLSQDFSDVELVSMDNKIFKAHRAILHCNSPVFAAMFKHDMVEKNGNKVHIEDINGDVISEMLSYMYTAACPNISILAKELVFAAEKYQLDGLKDICALTLIKDLTVDNAIQLFIFADKYTMENLVQGIYNLIMAKGGLKQFVNTHGWKDMSSALLDKLILNCS